MYRSLLRYGLFAIFLCGMLAGCNPNDDFALLMSYPKEGHCSIDAPERGAKVKSDEDIIISGWAYNATSKKIPPSLAMYIVKEDDQKMYTVTIKRGYKREDVARVLDNPSLVDSGFQGILEKNKLSQGDYQIILLQIDPHSGVISCAGEPHRIALE